MPWLCQPAETNEMPRELLLLRHGKSDWNVGGESDFHRPLAKRGTKAASRIGRWMKRHDLRPDCVLSSPARRARDTALRVCQKLALSELGIVWDDRVYDADVARLLEVLADCPLDCNRVLVVGHNPGLEDLLAYLCGQPLRPADDGKLLPTAALARIAMPDDWTDLQPGTAGLVGIISPQDLEG